MSAPGDTIAIGARVRATRNPDKDREYTADGQLARRQNDGQMGTVQHPSNAHGLCFHVRHDTGGAAWWEPEELAVIPEHPAVPLLRALQWEGGDGIAMCPDCKAPKYPRGGGPGKHEDDCRIAALLAKEEGRC